MQDQEKLAIKYYYHLFTKIVSVSAVSSIIRQKGESQNGGNKKTKHVIISEKRTFLTPFDAHTYVSHVFIFSEHLACFVFLLPPF